MNTVENIKLRDYCAVQALMAILSNPEFPKHFDITDAAYAIADSMLSSRKFTLHEWQSRHGFTCDTAADALGISRRTYARYLKKAELPKLVLLAMERIDEQKGMK